MTEQTNQPVDQSKLETGFVQHVPPSTEYGAPPPGARGELMKEMDERRKADMARHESEVGVYVEPETEQTPESTSEPEVAEQAEPELITIKVDGEESQVSKAIVEEHGGIRAYQMELAAAKRLAEAKELKRQVEQDRQAAVEWIRQQQTAPAPVAPAQSAEDEAQLVNTVRFSENPAEARAALMRLTGVQSRLTQDQMVQLVQQQLDANESQHWFAGEYKDIFEEPVLMHLATAAVREARAQGDQRPHRALLKSVGEGIRKWRSAIAPPATQPFAGKEQRKATSIPSIQTASGRAPAAPAEPPPKTHAQITEEQRKRRGLQ